MNVLRNLKLSLAFFDNFAIFSDFQNFMFSSGKTHLIFLYKNQILNVSRTFTLSVAFYVKIATFCRLLYYSFFSKIHQFLGKKWTFWEIAIFAEKSHSTATLLSLAILKNSCFFWKDSSSFPIKINFWTFWDFFYFCRIPRQNY